MTWPAPPPRRHAGFTLFEILVAVAIFVIIGTLAMGGYNELVQQSELVDDRARRTRQVQAAVQRLVQDLAALEPCPVREPLGDAVEPALLARGRLDRLAELTRSGWTNPAGLPRPTLQRVTYSFEDGKLQRDYWNVLDRTLSIEPQRAVLLDGVREVSLRFLDSSLAWHDQWPPAGYAGPEGPRLRPVAVEITLVLEDWGKIVRLVEIAG